MAQESKIVIKKLNVIKEEEVAGDACYGNDWNSCCETFHAICRKSGLMPPVTAINTLYYSSQLVSNHIHYTTDSTHLLECTTSKLPDSYADITVKQ